MFLVDVSFYDVSDVSDPKLMYKFTSTYGKRIIGIHSMQGGTATMRHGVRRKGSTKRLKQAGNLFRKNLNLKGVC